MNVYGITDCGLIRKMNQDCYASCCFDHSILAVVCDGMGGAKSGNIASQMAIDNFLECVKLASPEDEPVAVLNAALKQTNEAVWRHSQESPDCSGMGTTLVAAYVQNDLSSYILNVGDSRAYHIGKNGISQLTKDHSLVADLVACGKITKEEARNHPNKNIITRALGTDPQTAGDLFEVKLDQGDYILLCSDGLSNVVTDQEILYEVLYGGSDNSCCHRLLEIALHRGAPDNVTIMLISTDTQNK